MSKKQVGVKGKHLTKKEQFPIIECVCDSAPFFPYDANRSLQKEPTNKSVMANRSKAFLGGCLIIAIILLTMGIVALLNRMQDREFFEDQDVEFLGIPTGFKYWFGEKTYARNVWDMQSFQGRLYFGSGNSNNRHPAPNAGGGEVWVYDPVQDEFAVEFNTDEEQVHRFRILDEKLYIPGHDTTDPSWALGNWYRLETAGWKKYRNLPGGIHCYDIYSFAYKLFVALGTRRNSKFVLMSADDGRTWVETGIYGSRAYSLFTIADRLYVSMYRGVAEFDGDVFHERGPRNWFLDQGKQRRVRLVVRPVNFGSTTVYIGAHLTRDHQWTPFGLYAARSPHDIAAIELPGKHWDLLTRDSRLFVLSAIKSGNEKAPVAITVSVSEDLENWKTIIRFQARTFARSFELLDGDFYFGLGCEYDKLVKETGAILRARRETVPSVSH